MKRFSIARASLIMLLFAISSFLYLLHAAADNADEQPALRADALLSETLAKSDQRGLSVLLDPEFEWTDAEGKTRNKEQSIADLFSLSAANRGDKDIKRYFYGQLELISGEQQNGRFLRIWVKRPAGWRLLIYLDTPISARNSSPGGANNRGAQNNEDASSGDCENPCRTVPFKPRTEADKAVLAEWQKTKMDEWHPDAQDWATHIAEEFMIINNNSARNKEERVALAKRQQEAGIGAPGAPILSMSMSDFGNAVVMISHHVPYDGGRPYYNVRVFVNRDGHWPLVWSQQTTIQDAAPLPAANKSERAQ